MPPQLSPEAVTVPLHCKLECVLRKSSVPPTIPPTSLAPLTSPCKEQSFRVDEDVSQPIKPPTFSAPVTLPT